jgi:hypothetical protein
MESNWTSGFGWGIKPYGRPGGLRNFEADSFHSLERLDEELINLRETNPRRKTDPLEIPPPNLPHPGPFLVFGLGQIWSL